MIGKCEDIVPKLILFKRFLRAKDSEYYIARVNSREGGVFNVLSPTCSKSAAVL